MKLPRCSRLTALVFLAGAGAAWGQVQPQPAAEPAAVPPAPATADAAAAPGPGTNWVVPPVAVSGWVSYDLRASRAEGETNALSQLVTTHVTADTYIYQPWFATVSGTLGVTVGRSRGGEDVRLSEGPFATPQPAGSRDRFLTGGARIDVFPRSRFPFEAHFERTDSRVDNSFVSTLAFQTQNIGFSQRYRPASGAYSVSAGFDRREQISGGFRDIQNQWAGDFGTRWKYNELSLAMTQSQAHTEATDERTQFRSAVARHQFTPAANLSVSSLVNWTQTQEQGVAAATDLSVLQLSSVGLWQPGPKLSLTGSVRGLLLRDGINDRALDSFGVTLGANYELNKNARLTASGSATTANSDGTRSQGFSGSLGANWQGDTIEIKGLRYDWFVGGSVGGSTTSGGSRDTGSVNTERETQTTLAAQLGHTVGRTWLVTPQSTFALTGGQTLSVTQNHSNRTEREDLPLSSRILLHTLAATLNVNDDNRSAYARASYNDSRELGGTHARFQLLNFQVSGNYQFDRNRSLSGDLSVQRVTQRSADTFHTADPLDPNGLVPGVRSTGNSASGEITYRQQRLFGVPRLRFTSRLKLAQDVLKQAGTFNSIPDRETRLWENRLEWLVGRLETQVVFRVSQVDGKRRDLLMFRVQRNFGN